MNDAQTNAAADASLRGRQERPAQGDLDRHSPQADAPGGKNAAKQGRDVEVHGMSRRQRRALEKQNQKGTLPERVGDAPFALNAEVLQLNVRNLVRKQRHKFLIKIFLFVMLPTLLTAFYTLVYASPRYVSEFQIGYKSSEQGMSLGASSPLGSLLGGTGTMDMVKVLRSLLTSQKVMEIVDKKIGLRKEFSAPTVDYVNRMPADAPDEKFLDYFRRRVTVHEQTGSFLIVDVEGFSREYAKKFADVLIETVDTLVAEINDRAKLDMVRFTEKEMLHYDAALKKATRDLTDFREKHNVYDFKSTVGAMSEVIASLQAKLVAARSEMINARTFLGENAPSIRVLQARIKALEDQLQLEQQRLASNAPIGMGANAAKEPYSQVMAKYAELQQMQDFALQTYTSTRNAHEQARLESGRKSAYAVSFVPPNLPQYASEPNFLRYFSAVLIGSMLLYSFAHVLLGMLREQAGL